MNQKGLAPILIVLILAALVGGYLIYQNQSKTTPPHIQIGYNTVKLHSGKNSFELEMLISDNTFRPTQATVYDASGNVLKTYTVRGPWDSLCFDNKKVYKAIGTIDEIPGYKSVKVALINDENIAMVTKKELGEPCRLGTISIE